MSGEEYLIDKERFSTGIEELDVVLFGGYKPSTSVLFEGEVGPEKAIFAYYFLSQPNAICIAADDSPSELIKKASSFGIDISKASFIDAYSNEVKLPPRPKDIVVSSPSALNEISLALNKVLKPHSRVAMLSFSTIATSSSFTSAISFLKAMEAKVKKQNGVLMVLVDRLVHKEAELNKIRVEVDEVFYINKTDKGNYLSGDRLPIPIKFILTKVGIEFM